MAKHIPIELENIIKYNEEYHFYYRSSLTSEDGNYHQDFLNNMAYFYAKWIKDDWRIKPPELGRSGRCICGKHLENLHYIHNLSDDKTFQVGSSCVNKADHKLYLKLTQQQIRYRTRDKLYIQIDDLIIKLENALVPHQYDSISPPIIDEYQNTDDVAEDNIQLRLIIKTIKTEIKRYNELEPYYYSGIWHNELHGYILIQ